MSTGSLSSIRKEVHLQAADAWADLGTKAALQLRSTWWSVRRTHISTKKAQEHVI
jgi:hypothetical protein